MTKILEFPWQDRPAEMGTCSRWQRCRDDFALLLGRIASRVGIPAIIQPLDLTDELTGQRVSIRPGLLFTRLTINGRDYYFRRFTGRFDGTGMGCTSCSFKARKKNAKK